MSDVIEGQYTETMPVKREAGVSVIEQPQGAVVDLTSEAKLELAVKQVENAIRYKDRVLEIAAKTARPGAIIDQGGKPYYEEAECERLLSLLGGASISVLQPPVRQMDPDGHFGYTALVEIAHPLLGSFSGYGSAHSTDKFLGTNNDARAKAIERGDENPQGRTVGDVDRHNIAQHSLTRAKGSAIRRMLGLHGIDWETLEKWGYRRDKSRSVAYGNKGNGSGGARKSGGGQASGAKGRLMDAMKAVGADWKMAGGIAAKDFGWTGKLLEAPDEIVNGVAEVLERELQAAKDADAAQT